MLFIHGEKKHLKWTLTCSCSWAVSKVQPRTRASWWWNHIVIHSFLILSSQSHMLLGSNPEAQSFSCSYTMQVKFLKHWSTREHKAAYFIVSECSVMQGASWDLKSVLGSAIVMIHREAESLHRWSTLEVLKKHCRVREVLFLPLRYKIWSAHGIRPPCTYFRDDI